MSFLPVDNVQFDKEFSEQVLAPALKTFCQAHNRPLPRKFEAIYDDFIDGMGAYFRDHLYSEYAKQKTITQEDIDTRAFTDQYQASLIQTPLTAFAIAFHRETHLNGMPVAYAQMMESVFREGMKFILDRLPSSVRVPESLDTRVPRDFLDQCVTAIHFFTEQDEQLVSEFCDEHRKQSILR